MCSMKKLKEIGFISLNELTGVDDYWYWRKKYSNGDQYEITINYDSQFAELTLTKPKASGIAFWSIPLRWSVDMPMFVKSLGG